MRVNLFPSMTFAASAPSGSAPRQPGDASGAVESSGPSKAMFSLYATTVAMQALDVHSTLTALNAGAVERNPVTAHLASHPPAFAAFKAGVAVGLIYAGHHLAKKSKMTAVITLIGINSAYAFVVVHNYQVANRLR